MPLVFVEEAAHPSLRRAALATTLRLRQYIWHVPSSLLCVVSAHLVAYSSELGNLVPPVLDMFEFAADAG